MEQGGTNQVTRVLQAIKAGDKQAAADLLPLVYDQLRALARSRLAHVPPGNTLQPTALVHEAYMRLVGGAAGEPGDPGWDGRGHFFGAAARAMRDILVEQARRKSRIKAGGGRKREDLDDEREGAARTPLIEPPMGQLGVADDMIALDDALRRLEAEDARKAEAIMLTAFAGLTNAQAASALGVSEPTVERDLRFAKAWLVREVKAAGRQD